MTTTTTLESYQGQKTRHSEELSAFDGLFFAFSNAQLDEGLAKVKAEKSEIMSIGAGGFVRKDQAKDFVSLMKRHGIERKELRKNTKILVDAIVYELWNHEYCITGDPADALAVLDLTVDSVDPEIMRKALKQYRKGQK